MIEVLVVCTGNICRSPYAQYVFQAELDRVAAGTFSITSAGTEAMVGAGMDPLSAAALEKRGIDGADFTARPLEAQQISAADLVLAMTTRHRRAVIDRCPAALKRVYTLRELAWVIDHLGQDSRDAVPRGATPDRVRERWSALPGILGPGRSRVPRGEEDVADPYRQGPAAFALMVQQIEPALRSIVTAEEQWRKA